MAALKAGTIIHFGSHLVTSQVFYLTPFSFALVNLKPLLPGHVLVSPRRVIPRLKDLSSAEITDLFLTVQRVGRMIEYVYKASSLNIAMQDGIDAGQSVPHVHTHIIPRHKTDLDERGGGDAIYDMMEGEEGNIGRHFQQRDDRAKFPKPDNESREPRNEAEMIAEAKMLAQAMDDCESNLLQ